MRISDWSSDVCSSDLETADRGIAVGPVANQNLYVPARECVAHGFAIDPRLLVHLAGKAPVGGAIDEHGPAFSPQSCELSLAAPRPACGGAPIRRCSRHLRQHCAAQDDGTDARGRRAAGPTPSLLPPDTPSHTPTTHAPPRP